MPYLSSGKQYEKFDYYAKDPVYEVQDGKFIGGLAKDLGFTEMNAETMKALQEGKNAAGEQVIQTAGKGGEEHNPGKDFTFNLDKGISLLRFSSETPQFIKDAIDKAILAAGDEIVRVAVAEGMITTREHKNGEITHEAVKDVNSLAGYAFLQSTSRENDPHAHLHLALMNMAKTDDGYKAVKFEGMFRKDAKEFLAQVGGDKVYQVLEQTLGKDLSSIFEKNKVDGSYSITGISKELEAQFSTRSKEIKEVKAELREKYPAATEGEISQMANKLTRPEKNLDVTEADLENKAKPANETIAQTHNVISATDDLRSARIIDKERLAADVSLVAESLGKKEIYNSLNKLLKEVKKQDKNYTYEDIKEAIAADKDLSFRQYKDKEGLLITKVATAANIKAEQENYKFFNENKGNSFNLSKETVEKGIAAEEKKNGFKFSQEQRDAIELMLLKNDKANIIAGVSGAGKTTVFRSIYNIAKENGIEVIGISNNGNQALTLQKETGIKSYTIKKFQTKYEKAAKNDTGKFMIINDEMSMQGARDTNDTLKLAGNKFGTFKYGSVGDPFQIGAISAGRDLANALDTSASRALLTDIRRQKGEHVQALKGVLLDFYKEFNKAKESGDNRINGAALVDKLVAAGYIKVVENKEQEHKAAVNDYLTAAKSGEKDIIIVARTNAEKNALDHDVREGLEKMGKLTGPEYGLNTLKKVDVSDINKFRAESYKKGDLLKYGSNLYEVRKDGKGDEISVRAVAFKDASEVTTKTGNAGKEYIDFSADGKTTGKEVRSNKNGQVSYYAGKEFTMNLRDASRKENIEKSQRYQEQELKIKKGEKLRITENVTLTSYEKVKSIKYTTGNKSMVEQSLALNGQRGGLKGIIRAANRPLAGSLDAKKMDAKIEKAIASAKKKGYEAKEWQVGNSKGVNISKKVEIELKNGMQLEYIKTAGNKEIFLLEGKKLELDRTKEQDRKVLRQIKYGYAVTPEGIQGGQAYRTITTENEKADAKEMLVRNSRATHEFKMIVSAENMTRRDKAGNELKVENGKFFSVDENGKKKEISAEQAKGYKSNLDEAVSRVKEKTTSIKPERENKEQRQEQQTEQKTAPEKHKAGGTVLTDVINQKHENKERQQNEQSTGYDESYDRGRSR